MATNPLKRITTRAKAIRKVHPHMKWTDAIKKAGKEISGKKQSRAPAKKKAAPKKTKSATMPTRKKKTFMQKQKAFAKEVEAELGDLGVKKFKERSKPKKKKIQKQITAKQRLLKNLN